MCIRDRFGEAWADVKADIEGKSLKELEELYDHAEDYTCLLYTSRCV